LGIDGDILSDYNTQSNELSVKLDPSIRIRIPKKGLSIIENIYTGFDTEYENVDNLRNKLLSVQLSVNTRTLVRFPLNDNFNLEEIGVLTGELYVNRKYTSEFVK
jgi:hypothetical protein